MTTHKHDPALVESTAEAICDAEFWPGMWATLDKDSDECVTYRKAAIAALDAARPAIRREALEEAEKELEGWGDIYGRAAAATIRTLMEKP